MSAMGTGTGFGHVGDEQPTIEVVFSRPGPQDAGLSEVYPLRTARRVHGAHVQLRGTAAEASCELSVLLDGEVVGIVTVDMDGYTGNATFDPNAGYWGSEVNVAWTLNPPSAGCTVIVDIA